MKKLLGIAVTLLTAFVLLMGMPAKACAAEGMALGQTANRPNKLSVFRKGNNECYYFDAAGDDPIVIGGGNMLRHDYFLVPYETISMDHVQLQALKLY